jgi:2-phosphosulfolactate phosphatase
MQVRTLDFVAGAKAATGIAVVIDVFRAFTVAAHAMARGARTVIPVAELERAKELKQRNPDWLLIGERHARPLPGFDFGNSPTAIHTHDVRAKVIVHTTHAGTQGLTNADQADEVLTGALVNAAAIVRYIRAKGASEVTLVRMGHEARERCEEDDLCAQILAARLLDQHVETHDIRARLRNAAGASKFFDPACDWAPESDFDLCTEVDRFDFVLKLDSSASPACLRRIDVPTTLANR